MRRRWGQRPVGWGWLLAMAVADMGAVSATPVTVIVADAKGGLADAVVSLQPEHPPPPGVSATVSMDQVNSQFVPAVLAVRTGTLVRFPNKDQIRHQVYSFSPAKRFELPLYKGITAEPIRFEQPGLVTVGCNIHDWMLGYIVVLDTPYFGKTGVDGKVRLEAPPGNYQLRVWHRQDSGPVNIQSLVLGRESLQRRVLLQIADVRPAPAGTMAEETKMRALQEKFRRAGQKMSKP